MKQPKDSSVTTFVFLVALALISGVIAALIYGYFRAIYLEISIFISKQSIDKANLAFVLLTSISIPIYFLIHNSWKSRTTFISVSENHLVVEPCDRRDEFLEIIPSYLEK